MMYSLVYSFIKIHGTCLLVWLLSLASCTEWSKDDLPNDKFISFLQYPNINFNGRFKANVATGNNSPKIYNMDKFVENYSGHNNLEGGSNQWNTDGTNDFSLLECHIATACHVDGQCKNSKKDDEIINAEVKDGGAASLAKLVDIDTTFQLVTEVWALKINVDGYFIADMVPASLTQYWPRFGGGDGGSGGGYQSVLKNIVWGAKANSSHAIKQMRETMDITGSTELSIMFYLDHYSLIAGVNFTIGRIIGTIGVLGPKSPKMNTWGRVLSPINIALSRGKRTTSLIYTREAPFVIDRSHRRIYLNFGNSLTVNVDGSPTPIPGIIRVGYLKRSNVSCDDIVFIGNFPNNSFLSEWFVDYAGILSLNVTHQQIHELENSSLVLYQVLNGSCKIIMQEHKDGLIVKPMTNKVFRLEPGQPIELDFFVLKFGKPCKNITISFHYDIKNLVVDIPWIGKYKKPDVLSMEFTTNSNGIAHIKIPTFASKNKRTGLDGEVYCYIYKINGSEMAKRVIKLDSAVTVHVYDMHTYTKPVTWIDHVFPIFRQYANIFPVMKSRTFNMANYFDVVEHKEILKLSLLLPITHASYMPATRDLSPSKTKMIVEWLSQEKPLFGDVKKVFTKHYLQVLTQTALEITHASLPPLLTAFWSIKPRHNKVHKEIFHKIIRKEMQKIGFICNLMNSLHLKPKTIYKNFVPSYLSRLHGGIKPDSVLSIARLSEDAVRQIAEIKKPVYDLTGLWFRKTVNAHVEKNEPEKTCKQHNSNCKYKMFMESTPEYKKCQLAIDVLVNQTKYTDEIEKVYNQYIDPQDRNVFNYHSNIDQFFNHIILVLSYLTDCGRNHTIFNGEKYWQLVTNRKNSSVFGEVFAVNDYFTAVKAVRKIVDITNQLENGIPSQYSLLASTTKQEESLQIIQPRQQLPAFVKNEANEHFKEIRTNSQHPAKSIPIYSKGVWPITANGKVDMYPKGKIRNTALALNDMYLMFLKACQLTFKFENSTKRAAALKSIKESTEAMFMYAKRLVQMPLEKQGNKHKGPNAAPTFEMDMLAGVIDFRLEKKDIELLNKNNWKPEILLSIKRKKKLAYIRMRKRAAGIIQSIGKKHDKKDPALQADTIMEPLAAHPMIDVTDAYLIPKDEL